MTVEVEAPPIRIQKCAQLVRHDRVDVGDEVRHVAAITSQGDSGGHFVLSANSAWFTVLQVDGIAANGKTTSRLLHLWTNDRASVGVCS